jgi:hypothetical protein
MTLKDEIEQLMFFRDKIKEYRRLEEESKTRIVQYLKNHNQEGVIFKHNNRQVSLMVKSTTPRKNVAYKEKEQKVVSILTNAGLHNAEVATQDILKGLKEMTLANKPSRDRIAFKTGPVGRTP